jgi:bacillithiol system protein YtxJ
MNVRRFPLTLLQGVDELNRALSESHVRPLLLFKHSYTCGISAEALDELRAHIDEDTGGVAYAMVTVQTHRDISNEIAAPAAGNSFRTVARSFRKT